VFFSFDFFGIFVIFSGRSTIKIYKWIINGSFIKSIIKWIINGSFSITYSAAIFFDDLPRNRSSHGGVDGSEFRIHLGSGPRSWEFPVDGSFSVDLYGGKPQVAGLRLRMEKNHHLKQVMTLTTRKKWGKFGDLPSGKLT